MAFLISTFIAIKSLLDMGTSSAFFTFLSRRRRSPKFVLYFWLWVLLQFLFSLFLVGVILPESIISSIWKGEPRGLVLLALVASFMQFTVWPIASQMAEASRQTIRVQKLNVFIACLHLSLIITMWSLGKLSIPLLFFIIACEWFIAGLIASRFYRSTEIDSTSENATEPSGDNTLKSFLAYCLPFIPYVWFGFASEFADRWILQSFAGSVEQAYYGIAAQFASISLIATASLTKVLWKEVANSHEVGDEEKVKKLFIVSSQSIFILTACLACCLLPCADHIVELLLGSEYENGALTLSIMFLYPVHQSLGQIVATMYYALGYTLPYVLIGVTHNSISILVAYFMMAPTDAGLPGLGLGSIGLALKMVSVQFVMVNVSLLWLSRRMGVRYFVFNQISYLLLFLLIGFASRWLVDSLFLMDTVLSIDFVLYIFSYLCVFAFTLFIVLRVLKLNVFDEIHRALKSV
jgi:O-antigen/teichoic acid export membrane protein